MEGHRLEVLALDAGGALNLSTCRCKGRHEVPPQERSPKYQTTFDETSTDKLPFERLSVTQLLHRSPNPAETQGDAKHRTESGELRNQPPAFNGERGPSGAIVEEHTSRLRPTKYCEADP